MGQPVEVRVLSTAPFSLKNPSVSAPRRCVLLLLLCSCPRRVRGEQIPFKLPPLEAGHHYERLLDSSAAATKIEEFQPGDEYPLERCSVAVLRQVEEPTDIVT